ncbi:MAG: diaminopimelate epimerase [Gammaproteobacteria bacterium]
MRTAFVKMHGLGNDFVIIDRRRQELDLDNAAFARLADRRLGVGCDQVLVLETPMNARAHTRYRVVNADGSPAEHCGNGVRCVARYLERLGEASDKVVVEIGSELFELFFEHGSDVRVDMGVPRFEPAAIPLAVDREQAHYTASIGTETIRFGAVSMGNPHAVIEVPAVADAEVARLGPAVQGSGLFPAGVNVGFMETVSAEAIRLRVFERGAGETRACGTGACAAVALGRRWGKLAAQVTVDLPGGRLLIEWDGQPGQALWMTGPTTFVFEGTIDL